MKSEKVEHARQDKQLTPEDASGSDFSFFKGAPSMLPSASLHSHCLHKLYVLMLVRQNLSFHLTLEDDSCLHIYIASETRFTSKLLK